MISIIGVLSLVIATILGAFASLSLKRSSDRFSLSIAGIFLNREFLKGVALYIVATAIYLSVLRSAQLSVAYPLIAMQYIWISMLSVKYLKERMNVFKWAGIGLIVIGAFLIGLG